MTTDIDGLKENLRRWTLFLGVLQITVGCVVGFIPPSAVAWFRGIVMAHIEFTANGVLMVNNDSYSRVFELAHKPCRETHGVLLGKPFCFMERTGTYF